MAIIRYPSDEEKIFDTIPFVAFTAYDVGMAEATQKSSKINTTKIADAHEVYLYLPQGVVEGFGGTWGNEETINTMEDVGSQVSKKIKQQAGSLGAGAEAKSGKTPRPIDILLFQKPSQPQLSFNFEFIPRTQKEAMDIETIITQFKTLTVPVVDKQSSSATWGLIKWPAVWNIKFVNIKILGMPHSKIQEYVNMALTGVNITYAGGANSALVFYDGMPVKINMTLNFQSIMYAIKE